MMKIKRIWISFFLMILLVGMCQLPVNAASNKAKIKKVIKTYMSAAKKTNTDKMTKCYQKPSKVIYFNKHKAKAKIPNISKVIKKNKKITYKIKPFNISGKKATLIVKVNSPTIKRAIYYASVKLLTYAHDNPDISKSKALKKYFDFINTGIAEKGVQMYSHTITFKMIKTKKGWKIKNRSKSDNTDVDLVSGRFSTSLEEFGKELE